MMRRFKLFLSLTILTGLLYPLLITLVGMLTMHYKAQGSFIVEDGKKIGSKLIAQKFVQDKYFWPRPSSVNYVPLPSGASNLGPTSLALKKQIEERKALNIRANGISASTPVPAELLFASGSGLDPHISPETAYFQSSRVIKARGWNPVDGFKEVDGIIKEHTKKRSLGFIGVPCVNVLELNVALDKIELQQKKS